MIDEIIVVTVVIVEKGIYFPLFLFRPGYFRYVEVFSQCIQMFIEFFDTLFVCGRCHFQDTFVPLQFKLGQDKW